MDVESLQQVLRQLVQWTNHLERKKDGRAVFAYAYVLMTHTLLQELPRTRFQDPDWVVRLGVAFANRYLAALEEFERQHRTTGAWQDVFTAQRRRRASVVEDLIFGMAAHIVQDLPHTLLEVGMRDDAGQSRIADFHTVNEILGHALVPIRDGVVNRYAPYLGWLDILAEGYVELFTNYGIRVARGVAWYNADRLLDPASQADAVLAIAQSPGILVHEVFHPPGRSARALAWVARRIVAVLGRQWPATPLEVRPPSAHSRTHAR